MSRPNYRIVKPSMCGQYERLQLRPRKECVIKNTSKTAPTLSDQPPSTVQR